MPDFIFTKHAQERLRQRSISQSSAELVLRHPDSTQPGKKAGTIKFNKTVQGRNMQLVGTYLADQKKWLILSAWVRGEDDKEPLVWTIVTAPFRFTWWVIKNLK